MAEPDDPAEAAARLEQALERIAALSTRPVAPPPVAVEPHEASVDVNEIAARLDALIDRIRATLDHPSDG